MIKENPSLFLMIFDRYSKKACSAGNAVLESYWMRWDSSYGLHAGDTLLSKVAWCRIDCSVCRCWVKGRGQHVDFIIWLSLYL